MVKTQEKLRTSLNTQTKEKKEVLKESTNNNSTIGLLIGLLAAGAGLLTTTSEDKPKQGIPFEDQLSYIVERGDHLLKKEGFSTTKFEYWNSISGFNIYNPSNQIVSITLDSTSATSVYGFHYIDHTGTRKEIFSRLIANIESKTIPYIGSHIPKSFTDSTHFAQYLAAKLLKEYWDTIH